MYAILVILFYAYCYIRVCKECQKLVFFDVSFCSHVSEEDIKELRKLYPRVCFKRSFN